MENGRPAMNTDQKLLPSILYASFLCNSGEASIDYESLLLDLLSLLSTLEDIAPHFKSPFTSRSDDIDRGGDSDIVAWISKHINERSSNADDGIKQEEGSLLYEWSLALVYIRDLSQHITPFELHFLASQSILFSEGPIIFHRILCLLLCTHSLQQCPMLRQKRWKRWQSLVCETLRIFQDLIQLLDNENRNIDSRKWAFSLLTKHVVPSCLHVIDQLPLENTYHVAIFSGLVGTSSNIMEMIVSRCHEELSKNIKDTDGISSYFKQSLCIVHETVQSIIRSFGRFGGFSANTLWIESIRQPLDKQIDRNEDVDFWMNRDKLLWWIHHRDSHEPEERIANMDTSFRQTGLGIVAMKAFQERPKVYHPSYIWTIWSPHAVVVFNKAMQYPSMLQNVAFRFLESLVEIIRKESLVPEKPTSGVHLQLFDLLSNQLMSRIQKTKNNEEEKCDERTTRSFDEEIEFKERSQRTGALIRILLSRFSTPSQVQIIEKVIEDCSSPGLKVRYLDLLRPLTLISDTQTEKLLWGLLMSIVDDLFQKFWNCEEQILIQVEDLINRDVEISVGAITMIQMWSLAKGEQFNGNRTVLGANLQGFRIALQKLLGRWSEDISLAPKFHYRLFLLDSAIENTCQSLRNRKRFDVKA